MKWYETRTLYKHNVGIVKNYSDIQYKISVLKTMRQAGFEDIRGRVQKGSVNTEKLDNNIARARSTIYELAICNPWEYFCTFTIDGNKFGRYDLHAYHKSFATWLRNYNRLHECSIKYLLVPEQHVDGAWHEHGFFMGLPAGDLVSFAEYTKRKLPDYIRKKVSAGEEIYNWEAYEHKFGWCDIEPIRNRSAAAKYVTKYISKGLEDTCIEVNAKLYYCSKGLKRAEEMKKGTMVASIVPDFENDYVAVASTSNRAKAEEWMRCIID